MSLERKDIRAKLDPDMHAALTVPANVENIGIGAFIEREMLQVINKRIHDASLIHEAIVRLGKSGNRRESHD